MASPGVHSMAVYHLFGILPEFQVAMRTDQMAWRFDSNFPFEMVLHNTGFPREVFASLLQGLDFGT